MPVPVTLLVAANQLILITAFFMLVLFKAAICCLFQCDRREKKGIRSAENHYACHHEGELLPAFFMKFPSYVSSDSFIHFRSGLSLPALLFISVLVCLFRLFYSFPFWFVSSDLLFIPFYCVSSDFRIRSVPIYLFWIFLLNSVQIHEIRIITSILITSKTTSPYRQGKSLFP